MTTETQQDNMHYDNPDLALVMTRQECKMLYQKSYTQIDLALANHRLDGRTSLTGGTVLISVVSALKLWGPPKDKSLMRLYRGRSIPYEGFREALSATTTPKLF